MHLRDAFLAKTTHQSITNIAKRLGYSNRQLSKAKSRISDLLASHTLGLDEGGYDFRYTNKELFYQLAALLEIDLSGYADEISKLSSIEHDNESESEFQPSIFAETHFKRRGEPIWVLGLLENRRRITVNKKILSLPLEEQLIRVGFLIKRHNKQWQGKLILWGNIHCYKYFYGRDTNDSNYRLKTLYFSRQGRLIDTNSSENVPSGALLVVADSTILTLEE